MMPQIECSYKELMPIHKLQPHPKNPHIHSPEQIQRLAKLIDYQGIRHPIIISKRSGFIVAGHGRLEALKKLNADKVPVDYQEFENEAQEYAFIVSDNAIGKDEWSVLDFGEINKYITELGPDLDLENLGLKNFHIDLNENSPESDQEKELKTDFDHECPECGFQFD